MPSKLALAIARQEGYGIPGVIPTTHNNPGDLEHAPDETHNDGTPVGEFTTAAEGWDALERQLQLYADRGMTVQQMIYEKYAPPSENDSAAYLAHICAWVGCSPDALVSDVLAS
jgi:hypothetical protein